MKACKSSGVLDPTVTILVCPLNWGLGHAARLIPVVHRLRAFPVRIVLASDGNALQLLRETFPNLEWARLPFPAVRYYKAFPAWLSMLLQLPAFLYGIMQEHRLAKILVRRYQADIVISDNRFGLGLKNIHSVYLTHQVSVSLPSWLAFMEFPLYRLHCRIISRYSRCWIPDHADAPYLSGKLSHAYPLPGNAVFIGTLSHFSVAVKSSSGNKNTPDIAVVLSGPEPQRSIFERLVLEQLRYQPYRWVLVRGTMKGRVPEAGGRSLVVPFMNSPDLLDLLLNSRLVICRSGYSSVMDLVWLGKRAVLVPTPGQTEQEYLASYMKSMGAFYSMPQKKFCLETVLKESEGYHPEKLQRFDSGLSEEIDHLLQRFLTAKAGRRTPLPDPE